MKKIYITLIIFALMFAFVACSGSPEEKDDPAPTPEPVPVVEKQTIYIPGFEIVDSSRGMTGFPEDNPFTSDDWKVGSNHIISQGGDPLPEPYQTAAAKLYLACNAMSNLPMLPPFVEHKEVDPDAFAAELESGRLKIYGFDAEVTASKVNDDGIYLFITAYEGQKPVAIAEYYYSWEKETFSYREIVTAFLYNFEYMGEPMPLSNTLILMEMYDVPIKNENGVISFSAGVNNGELNSNTDITQYRIALPAPTVGTSPNEKIFFFSTGEYHTLLNHTSDVVSGAGYENYWKEYGPGNPKFHTLLGGFFSDSNNRDKYNFTYDVSVTGDEKVTLDDAKCNIEFAYDVLDYFFNGFGSLKTESAFSERTDGIKSITDFNALKYVYKSEAIRDLFRTDGLVKDLNFPVMFSIKDKKGSTSDFLDSGLYHGPGWDVSKLASFKDTDLFGLAFETKDDFSKLILQYCGLSETNAAALVEEMKTAP